MGFPQKFLNEGEDIVLDLRPHWWFLLAPTLLVFGAAVITTYIGINESSGVAVGISVGILVLSVLWFVGRYLRWMTTNFTVTTDRIIYRAGVIAKKGKEIPLERVNDITFNQRIIERVLGAGDLLIESGGERGQSHFTDIAKPSIVQNVIYREMERAQQRDADRSAGRRELSLPEQLEKLDDLRQSRGVISQAEFDAKKAQLLERM